MWVDGVVVLESFGQALHDADGVGPGVQEELVPLEGFHEGPADTAAFWAASGRDAREEVECRGEVGGFGRSVGGATVSQPSDRLRGTQSVEPALYGPDREIIAWVGTYGGGISGEVIRDQMQDRCRWEMRRGGSRRSSLGSRSHRRLIAVWRPRR